MRTENRSFKYRGKVYSGVIVWPNNLQEAIQLLDPADIWEAFRLGYLEHCRRQICGIPIRRRKIQKIDVSGLPPHEQEAILLAVEQMRALYQQPLQAQKSVQPESQPIAPSDSDETPEEAEDSVSSRELSFEEDFAKYSAALDSSLLQHTETA